MVSYVVWGNSNSWIVLQVDNRGRTLWRSRWFGSQEAAELSAARLRRR